MRKEAGREEWKKLYDVATRIRELKPWEDFWDLDLICLREGEKEDAAFVSILGKGGEYYGIVVYEGSQYVYDDAESGSTQFVNGVCNGKSEQSGLLLGKQRRADGKRERNHQRYRI